MRSQREISAIIYSQTPKMANWETAKDIYSNYLAFHRWRNIRRTKYLFFAAWWKKRLASTWILGEHSLGSVIPLLAMIEWFLDPLSFSNPSGGRKIGLSVSERQNQITF